MLIPHTDANIQDTDGWTALHIASNYSNTQSTENTVEILIRHTDVNIQDNYGRQALKLLTNQNIIIKYIRELLNENKKLKTTIQIYEDYGPPLSVSGGEKYIESKNNFNKTEFT